MATVTTTASPRRATGAPALDDARRACPVQARSEAPPGHAVHRVHGRSREPEPFRRYHGLDALRAGLMCLGIVLHVGLCYGDGPWLWKDARSSGVVWVATTSIHIFRMPLFFALAGFFAAMVHERSGAWSFAARRFERIAVPLGLGWFALFPLVALSIVFAWTYGGVDVAAVGGEWAAAALAVQHMPYTTDWSTAGPLHLWFLYDLLLFYAAALVLVPVVGAARPVARRITALLDALVLGRWRGLGAALGVAALTAAMLQMRVAGVETEETWRLNPPLLTVYGLWFLVGWIGWGRREVVDRLQRGWGWRVAVSAVATIAAAYAILEWHVRLEAGQPASDGLFAAAQLLSVLSSWFGLLGLVGLCERFLGRERRVVRYFVDASYFVYLAHLPLALVVPALLRTWPAGALLKCAVAVLIVLGALLLLYQLFVRHTVVAVLLNGRRPGAGVAARGGA